ncbi:leucine aminopeptidase 1 isoform X1 [Brassica rapa]|uniref:leucine aminopeptidase 1 isoform X1 n=1 Tax=Brassica campestris TaxID=3711 RepID=UPI00142E59F2|nr:leucine aminopeptidase 1 isoform X1 [Brassica rapa]
MAHSLGLTQPKPTDHPKISFSAKDIDVTEWKGDLLVVGVTEKDSTRDSSSKFENPILNKLDAHSSGLLALVSSEEDFNGKPGQSTVLRLPGLGSKRIGLIGLGKSAAFQSLGEAVATVAKASQSSSVGVALASHETESKLSSASALASGVVLGLFEDGRFKSESKKPSLSSVDIIGFGTGPELEKKLKYAEDVSYGVIFGRELTNSPANVLTPAVLAEEAVKVASSYSDVFTANILNEEQCRELKMGSYLAVAAASANPPFFIHLVYRPSSGDVKTKLALVGKGLTFDSGGYNIKAGPGSSIELMKFDMGGSAAVLGAAKAIGEIKPPGVEVHFIVAACENMISGTGMRPGDVITASNGKTIEVSDDCLFMFETFVVFPMAMLKCWQWCFQVNNTDAEGRLTLADALVYACNQGVDKIVDLATLTGACVIALGTSMAGIYTPNDELATEVIAASEKSGEKLWRMPLEESYWEMMKSGCADMVNTGGRAGGSITAALFLKQFVSEKVQWMHIDMAGPVWNEKKKSGTGFGVATLVEWVQTNSSA